MKIFKFFGNIFIPVLSIIYGIGEYEGWWDILSGRQTILDSYDRLLNGNGFPKACIYQGEKEFKKLKNYLEKRTSNPRVKALVDSALEPVLITVDGGGARKWQLQRVGHNL
ncbi:MAG TPA: hypothetical protein VK543_05510 [Puia sp.]|nr:hypothetical protein [Puia sp.]